MTRPDLHTADHDDWDQGGYCNALVTDSYGATTCGYQKRVIFDLPWAVSTCTDPEAHATSFNQGFDTAVAQGLTEDPAFAEEWLHDRIRKEVALAFNEAADHLLELWTAGSPELPRGAVAIATWLRERTAEPLELELPTPPPDKPAPDCCCSWGAAVAGEYPENGCADCPVHQGSLGEARRCRRHARACESYQPRGRRTR